MTISKRTLENWRREALDLQNALYGWESETEFTKEGKILSEHILKLTQILIDQELMKKVK